MLEFEEGEGRCKDMVGRVRMLDSQGVRFWVGTGLSDFQRTFLWENRNELMGKSTAVVFHYGRYAKSQIPRTPSITAFNVPEGVSLKYQPEKEK